jgi:hypothetical protein
MNHETDNDRLLADTFSEDTHADFREAMLGQTLRLVRRRCRWRQMRRGSAALAVLGLLGILIRLIMPHPPSALPLAGAGCDTIHTQPLPAGSLVTTQPFSPDRLIVSVANVNVIQTTAATGDYREIGDDELLALVAPRPVVLVGCGPQCKQLIFVNPEDEKGFPVN